MNTVQQHKFVDLAYEYASRIMESNAVTEIRYQFKNPESNDVYNIYFYDQINWEFEIRIKDEYSSRMILNRLSHNTLSFAVELSEKEIDEAIKSAISYYDDSKTNFHEEIKNKTNKEIEKLKARIKYLEEK